MLAALAERADSNMVRMEVVTLDRPGPVARRLAESGISVRCLGGRGLVVAFIRLARVLCGGRYDVVAAYGLKATAVSRLLTRCLAPSAAFICGIRGLHSTELEDPTGPKSKFLLRLERLGSPLVALYDANSAGALDLLESAGISRDKLHYIPNGIDSSQWSFGTRSSERTPVVLCVARFVPRKRHLDLIEAARVLIDDGVDLRLVLAGGGPMMPDIRRASAELDERVELVGEVTGKELRTLYSGADLFCLCSLWEGMAGSVMEAMAASLPVVGTRVNGITDLIVEYETGLLVEPQAPRDLARALKVLIVDPGQRKAYGRAGNGRIRAHFSLDQMVSSKELLYRRASGMT